MSRPPPFSGVRILREVAKAHGLTVGHVTGPSKDQDSFKARAEIAFRLRQLGLSAPRIGAILNRDHTSVLYYINDALRNRKRQYSIRYMQKRRQKRNENHNNSNPACSPPAAS
jgi:chromosomal replication initiation ATPase DnaA